MTWHLQSIVHYLGSLRIQCTYSPCERTLLGAFGAAGVVTSSTLELLLTGGTKLSRGRECGGCSLGQTKISQCLGKGKFIVKPKKIPTYYPTANEGLFWQIESLCYSEGHLLIRILFLNRAKPYSTAKNMINVKTTQVTGSESNLNTVFDVTTYLDLITEENVKTKCCYFPILCNG